jgi:RimJ/RimL family protein N-acetyltransferase
MMDLIPVVLQSKYVRLEPLSMDHLDQLCEIGLEESIWKWTISLVRSREEMEAYIKAALSQQEHGTGLPFATLTNFGPDNGYHKVAGCTRFFNIEQAHKRLEIGHTWIAKPWQRTAVNTEAKYLMLKHAFETMGCNRVEFKTDALNVKSRTAIQRIGAKEEGILRKHSITATGRTRDTVYYSIVDDEWSEVKNRLEKMMSGFRPTSRY